MKKILTNLEEIIAAFFLAVVLSVVVVNVALRFLTTKSFAWLEEVSYFSFAWMIFMGASIGCCMHSVNTVI